MDDVHLETRIVQCCDNGWNDTPCERENIDQRINPEDRDRWNRAHTTTTRTNDVDIEHGYGHRRGRDDERERTEEIFNRFFGQME